MSLEYAELSAEALQTVNELEADLSAKSGDKIILVVYKEVEDE